VFGEGGWTERERGAEYPGAVATHDVTATQKNAILSAIQESGLDPADFEWTEEPSVITQTGPGRDPYTVEVLVHEPTGYSFRFDVDDSRGSLWAIYHPGPQGARKRDHAGSWDYVFAYVRGWLRQVKAEHEAPDFWAELRRARDQLGGGVAVGVENTPFTDEDQAKIRQQLEELKQYVRQTHELTQAQYREIDARLDYFTDAAGRLGRLDWRNAFLGAFIGAVIQDVLPPDPVQQVLHLALRGLAGLFGTDIPELPGLSPPAR
jgi:hypothetical protein